MNVVEITDVYKRQAGMNVGIAGNIGQSLAYQVAECNYDYYVIELSSFQLDNMYKFHAKMCIRDRCTFYRIGRHYRNLV